MALSDYQTLVADLVRDDADRITAGQVDEAIATAVERYSQDRPRMKVEDLAGVSGQRLTLPGAWQADFSELASLEYPVGDIPPTFIEADRWSLYDEPAAQKIMLLDSLPAGSTVRARYTIRHVVDAGTDSITLQHREAVAKYAASQLCGQLAAFYANETDSTIAADSVRQTTKAQAYRDRERDYRKAYLDAVGVEEKTGTPAGVVVNLHSYDSHGQDFLQHPRRFR